MLIAIVSRLALVATQSAKQMLDFTMIWYLLLRFCVGIYWNWFELDWRGQLLVCVAVVFQLGLRGSQQLLLYIVSTPNHFYMTIRQLG
jgi:hypothetical protein